MNYIIVSFYNEGNAVRLFLENLVDACEKLGSVTNRKYLIVCVDDNSIDNTNMEIASFKHDNLRLIKNEINIGQRDSLLKGLKWCVNNGSNDDFFCLIDGDGEDNPQHISDLFKNLGESNICMAQRISRSEGLMFKMFYLIYKLLFRLVCGVRMNVGNFSVFDKRVAIWLLSIKRYHLAASFLNSRFDIKFVPLQRHKRIDGKSKIGFVGLVMHAYLSLIEFLNVIVVRISVIILFFMFVFIGSGLFVGYKLIINEAIPGWTSTMLLMLLLIISFCIFIIIGLMNLILLKEKNNESSRIN
jgi:glycosyltransferase involved in cell wall biosynthesis